MALKANEEGRMQNEEIPKSPNGDVPGKMGSFFFLVSYAMHISNCGYSTIQDDKMGSFGNFS